ncbi:MAG: RsmE family RNA methyltransferase [Verrucomicrobiaceae bacterium]
MDRFWISPDAWDESFSLVGEEAHHCRRVMRKQVGEEIEVFDGAGRSVRATISSISANEVGLEAVSEVTVDPPSIPIELAVGIPKGKTFDLIVQKAVELGVAKIHPLMSRQGNVKIEVKEAAKKAEKWNRLALEASKQCGQNRVPEVEPPRAFDDWLKSRNKGDLEIAGALVEGAEPLRALLDREGGVGSIVLLVGPEGDFSPEEYEAAFASGFYPVSLGRLILRVETAVFYLLSNVICRFAK